MKKVRFESPRHLYNSMDESECHFPRPFVEVPTPRTPPECFERILPYSPDPVQRYENSNSSPYPAVNKLTVQPLITNQQPEWSPSNDLELSMLDGSTNRLRQPTAFRPAVYNGFQENVPKDNTRVLTSIQNNHVTPPNVLTKDDNGFFIRRDNIGKLPLVTKPLQSQFLKPSLGKENDPLAKREEILKNYKRISPEKIDCPQPSFNDSCRCHHCIKVPQTSPVCVPHVNQGKLCCSNVKIVSPPKFNFCSCSPRHSCCSPCDRHTPVPNICNCETVHKLKSLSQQKPLTPTNAVDKKAWALERYGQGQNCDSKDIEKQTSVSKEKREPTVADLFKIIKLQNEQLQLLQEKVDKFISSSEAAKSKPCQNIVTEQLAFQRANSSTSEEHKISIGVMTSFEMVRTSTVINQEFVKQNDNSQIQCNRSQISIKEVVSTSQPVNLNFLEGIVPAEKPKIIGSDCSDNSQKGDSYEANGNDDNNDDKTYNEQSLYNLQVENATTPLISPDQSLFLDVKDYSDSDESIIDRSNVGWTYYNKVMTHVNGLLHDSDMPSSASAMYKNTRQQCMQMQIDKTNLSVMKRVKFGDDPLGVHQPHIYAAATDTSMKMNQLAAKYLKPVQHVTRPTKDVDISVSKKYNVESHKVLTGTQTKTQVGELPRFLDITALKQQTKLL